MYRHIWAEIDLDALQHNITQILSIVPAEKIMGVIKANAYGHGAGAFCEILEQNNINNFAVSNVYEALDLRQKSKNSNILILGNADPLAVKELADKTGIIITENLFHQVFFHPGIQIVLLHPGSACGRIHIVLRKNRIFQGLPGMFQFPELGIRQIVRVMYAQVLVRRR